MWEFALVNASTYKCHYTPGSTTSWHHHLSKLFWPEKVRNLYVTFWCQQGAEMSLVSNGSFQKITITTSNQSPIHKIIHQYFLISFASKYPLHQLCPGLLCSVSADARVCGTPGAVLLVVPLVWIRAVWAEPCTIPIWLVDRKFYLVTPCHCDIEAGVVVTRVWRVWPHSDNASVSQSIIYPRWTRNGVTLTNPLDALKVTLGRGDFMDVGLFDNCLIQLFHLSLGQAWVSACRGGGGDHTEIWRTINHHQPGVRDTPQPQLWTW